MTFEEAEKAAQYLVDSAASYANARAEATLADARLRHIKALAMKASGEPSVGAQEREAYASDAYGKALAALFTATKEMEYIRAAREAARVRVDLWRSWNANMRDAG
jgi:hypothetical protein